MSHTRGVTPTDNLVRARYGDDTIEMRMTDGGDGRTLHGHFSVFDQWTEINSRYEGRFLERITPGSFKRAFSNTKGVRVLYEHGGDPSIGNKPIANPTVLREDDIGAYYEAEMFDASYANDLIPALRAGQLGASFRFRVDEGGEEWVDPRKESDHNPERLPERTVRSVSLYEFGPCPWGAYPDATAGVRSGTDSFIDRLLTDPAFVARLTERAGLTVVERILAEVPDVVRTYAETPEDGQQANEGSHTKSLSAVRARLALAGVLTLKEST